jgi:hypothetical protein
MQNHRHWLGAVAVLVVFSSCHRRKDEQSHVIEPLSQAPSETAKAPNGASSRRAPFSGGGRAPSAPAPPAAEVQRLSAQAPSDAASLPVRWSPELKLDALADAKARWARADGLGFGELELGQRRVLPTTCQQWAELRQGGYEPSTGLEVQPDGGAMVRCETLRHLQKAKPAQRGFVRDLPTAGRELLAILPVAVATAESTPRAQRVAALTKQGKALVALDPKAKVRKDADGHVHIAEGDGQSVIELTPQAWADFNGDGTDDVAMAVVNSMTQGSYSTARLLFLTRGSAKDLLRVIEPD